MSTELINLLKEAREQVFAYACEEVHRFTQDPEKVIEHAKRKVAKYDAAIAKAQTP